MITNVLTSIINLRVASNAINARRLPLAPLVYALVRPLVINDYLSRKQFVPPAAAAAHAAWVKGQKEVDVLMLLTMYLDIQWNLAHLGAYDMLQELKALFSKQAEQELLQTVREFHACQ
ncbi:hypothetical protein Tco_0381725 [Tanacetum coccineum]